jgi:hypothetical protein
MPIIAKVAVVAMDEHRRVLSSAPQRAGKFLPALLDFVPAIHL